MIYLHVLMAMLAAWRMTDMFGQDRITGWIRNKWPSYLWTCTKCLSVWAGIAATAGFFVWPWLNWPFALSWLYLAKIEQLITRQPRKIVIAVDQAGRIALQRVEVAPDIALNVLKKIVADTEASLAPKPNDNNVPVLPAPVEAVTE